MRGLTRRRVVVLALAAAGGAVAVRRRAAARAAAADAAQAPAAAPALASAAAPPERPHRPRPRPEGGLYAGEVGERVGVSGTTIGQWARWGYIRSSISATEPRVYSESDATEAAVVAALLERGVRRGDVHRTIERLGGEHEPWPLTGARLATTTDEHPPRVVLLSDPDAWALGDRGWQLLAVPPPYADLLPLTAA